jgi:hypothetical protein
LSPGLAPGSSDGFERPEAGGPDRLQTFEQSTDLQVTDRSDVARTVADMQNGLALIKRAELIAGNLRNARALAPANSLVPVVAPLANVIPLVTPPPPPLEHPPTTRMLDDKGRLSVRLCGRGLAEVMGWETGSLNSRCDGNWVVLSPGSKVAARRNDGTARLGDDGRLRLPTALRRLLGVELRAEVAVLALPDHNAVALCHPARLLVGAPLSILNETQSDTTATTGENR